MGTLWQKIFCVWIILGSFEMHGQSLKHNETNKLGTSVSGPVKKMLPLRNVPLTNNKTYFVDSKQGKDSNSGTKTQPWEVDAISGATITSRAIANGLRETTVELVPLIAQHLPEITSPPEIEAASAETEVIK